MVIGAKFSPGNVLPNLEAAARAGRDAERRAMYGATSAFKRAMVRNRMSGPTGPGTISVRSGNARRLNERVEIKGDRVEGRVGSPLMYVKWLEEGTGPYMIFPRVKKALRFVVNGETIFARSVRHPGLKARNMFRDELAAMRPTLMKLLGKDVAAEVAATARGRRR
jgi:hypothetical protein